MDDKLARLRGSTDPEELQRLGAWAAFEIEWLRRLLQLTWGKLDAARAEIAEMRRSRALDELMAADADCIDKGGEDDG